MNQFTFYRGNPDTRHSKALEFRGNSHAVRFSVSKSIAISSLGFYRPSVTGTSILTGNDIQAPVVRVYLFMMESPFLNQDLPIRRPPSHYLDETAYDVAISDQTGNLVFKCNLERAVLVPKNTVIEIHFSLMVHGSPSAKFLRLPDDHPTFSTKLEQQSQTAFTFYSSSKQLASIGFSLLAEVWGSGAVYLEDGRVLWYKPDMHALERGILIEEDDQEIGYDWERNNNGNVQANRIEIEDAGANDEINVHRGTNEGNCLMLAANFLQQKLCAIL